MALSSDHVLPHLAVFLIMASGSLISYGQSFVNVNSFAEQSELINTNGVAVADYDLDGDLDIYMVAADELDANDSNTWSRLLRNDGDHGFTDVTLEANLINWQLKSTYGSVGAKTGASWGDYDNDGFPDIFLSISGYDELWHNEGNGLFTNVSEVSGVKGCENCYSTNGLWWDYDLDGDLDLYVSDWNNRNRFYRNDGGGIFANVGPDLGLHDGGKTFTSIPIDVDSDGFKDLYVVNDGQENTLYQNDGQGGFKEVAAAYGLANKGNGMGADICDYNNDGNFDIYLTNIFAHEPNPFFVNQGNGVFANQSELLGIDNTGWGWGARFFDADHDLDEDLYVVNGFKAEIADGDRNMFFNNDGRVFKDIAPALGINDVQHAMGLEVFDYDSDGDFDILVANRNSHSRLYKNLTVEESGENANWIQIELEGSVSNRNAFGSTVSITCEGADYHRYFTGVNLFGQSIKPLHFGLGSHQFVDKITVTWPDGSLEFIENVEANQLVKLKEGSLRKKVVTGTEHSFPDDMEVRLFPNPFDEEIQITSKSIFEGDAEFHLVNALGQKIFYKKINIRNDSGIRINLSENKSILTSGIYFYYVIAANRKFSGTIVKR
ncbi:MAG: FG-GAP-like repeat-containing protein [Bacteroidetes bacterium]|nr:FG-GAP-like repeat-containing protein [Bacteroidota bacterium]